MIDYDNKKLSTCKVNECVIMTNRDILAFSFSSKFYYAVSFAIDVTQDPKEFCANQSFII